MTKTSLMTRAAIVAGTILLAAATAQSSYAAAPGAAPAARILIIDLRRAIGSSKVGLSIQTQVNATKSQAQTSLNGEAEGLKRERQAIETQAAILAADVKARKMKDFQLRAMAFEKKVQERGGLIQGGMLKANQQVEEALGPILQGIMQERQATVLLDRSAVLLAPNAIDVTGVVVQRLDTKMGSVKVDLAPLPAGMAAAAAARQQQGQ